MSWAILLFVAGQAPRALDVTPGHSARVNDTWTCRYTANADDTRNLDCFTAEGAGVGVTAKCDPRDAKVLRLWDRGSSARGGKVAVLFGCVEDAKP